MSQDQSLQDLLGIEGLQKLRSYFQRTDDRIQSLEKRVVDKDDEINGLRKRVLELSMQVQALQQLDSPVPTRKNFNFKPNHAAPKAPSPSSNSKSTPRTSKASSAQSYSGTQTPNSATNTAAASASGTQGASTATKPSFLLNLEGVNTQKSSPVSNHGKTTASPRNVTASPRRSPPVAAPKSRTSLSSLSKPAPTISPSQAKPTTTPTTATTQRKVPGMLSSTSPRARPQNRPAAPTTTASSSTSIAPRPTPSPRPVSPRPRGNSNATPTPSTFSNSKVQVDVVDSEGGISYKPICQSVVYPPTTDTEYSHVSAIKFEEEQLLPVGVSGFKSEGRQLLLYGQPLNMVIWASGRYCVCLDLKLKQQTVFARHTDEVAALALSNSGELVCSGQVGTPLCYVWSPRHVGHGVKELQLDNVQLGIAAVAFSSDDKRVFTVGSDTHHTVTLWEWEKQHIVSSARGHDDRILSASAYYGHPHGFATVGIKHVKFWTPQPDGSLLGKKGLFGSMGSLQPVLCSVSAPSQIVSGTHSGDLYIWRAGVLACTVPAHSGPVYALSISPSYYKWVSGGRDGVVKLWDATHEGVVLGMCEIGVPVRHLCFLSEADQHVEVVAVTRDGRMHLVSFITRAASTDETNAPPLEAHLSSFHAAHTTAHAPEGIVDVTSSSTLHRLVSIDKSSNIFVWNVHTQTMIHSITSVIPNVATCVSLHPTAPVVMVGYEGGAVMMYNIENGQHVTGIQHLVEHRSDVHVGALKCNSAGDCFAAVVSDGRIVMLHYSQEERVVTIAAITDVPVLTAGAAVQLDWSEDDKVLQTCDSGSQQLQYWDQAAQAVVGGPAVRDVKWSSYSAPLGWSVLGIWPKMVDAHSNVQITAVGYRSNVSPYLVSGDDTGAIQLYRYPAYQRGQRHIDSTAHVGAVYRVELVQDSNSNPVLVTVGSKDSTLVFWRLKPSDVAPTGVSAFESSASAPSHLVSTATDDDTVISRSESDVSESGSESHSVDSSPAVTPSPPPPIPAATLPTTTAPPQVPSLALKKPLIPQLGSLEGLRRDSNESDEEAAVVEDQADRNSQSTADQEADTPSATQENFDEFETF